MTQMIRRMVFLFLLIMILISSPIIAYTESMNENEEVYSTDLSVEPFWFSQSNAESYIDLNGNSLYCGGTVRGKSGASKISAIMILEEREGGSWRRVNHWSKISYSNFLTMSGRYNAISGRTYRLTISADITVNGTTERVSNSTEIIF